MIRLKPLPPLALTDLQPSFYDVESVSTVEMVSKLYAYLQNMVNDYNNFVSEINRSIDEFETGMIDDFECFKNCIIKITNDFIETIDIKINLQDTKIDENIERQDQSIAEKFDNQDSIIENAINYMKTNIVTTTRSVVNQAIENGDITVSMEYDDSTEALNIIVTREGE